MAEKCPKCNEKVKNGELITECPNCKTQYHTWCWNFIEKCSNCGFININCWQNQNVISEEDKRQQQERQQEKEQNNTEVKSNQEDCVNHESTNQPKTNISVQHEHSKKNIVSGIVFIVLGVIMILHSTGRSGGFAAFGGDFYTEIHEQVSLVVSNLHSIAIILKDGFGFLFIGLGVDRLIKK